MARVSPGCQGQLVLQAPEVHEGRVDLTAKRAILDPGDRTDQLVLTDHQANPATWGHRAQPDYQDQQAPQVQRDYRVPGERMDTRAEMEALAKWANGEKKDYLV